MTPGKNNIQCRYSRSVSSKIVATGQFLCRQTKPLMVNSDNDNMDIIQ